MVTLVFKKHFTKGNLVGLTITDHLPFVSTQRAFEWTQNVAANKSLDWEFCQVCWSDYAFQVFDAKYPLEAVIDQFEQWYEAWK